MSNVLQVMLYSASFVGFVSPF